MQHCEYIPHNIHLKVCPNVRQIENPTDAIVLFKKHATILKLRNYFGIISSQNLFWNYLFILFL